MGEGEAEGEGEGEGDLKLSVRLVSLEARSEGAEACASEARWPKASSTTPLRLLGPTSLRRGGWRVGLGMA